MRAFLPFVLAASLAIVVSGCAREATPVTTPMDVDRFWEIVERARCEGGEDEHAERLEKLLQSLSAGQVMEFEAHYVAFHRRARKGDVWAAGMLLNHGHGTDDGFHYFRHWLIAQGRQVYEAALADPDSLASVDVEMDEDGPSAEWESYGYAGMKVYKRKTGRDVDADLRQAKLDQPVREEDFDWQVYTDAVLAQRLPKLWSKYGRFKQAFDQRIQRMLKEKGLVR